MKKSLLALCVACAGAASSASAATVLTPTPFNAVPFNTGNPVTYVIDLVALGFTGISSVTLVDDANGSSGGANQGFDLDAIGLFNTVPTAPFSGGATPDMSFTEYSLSPGSPGAPTLTGSSPLNTATLDVFDQVVNSSHFVSFGNGGSLTASVPGELAVAVGVNQYLVIQDIGARDFLSEITLSQVPLPASGFMLLAALGGTAFLRRRRS